MDIATILEQCDIIETAVQKIRAECQDEPAPEPPSPDATIDREAIINAVMASPVPGINWADRGTAPLGYAKGMGLCYAMIYRDWLLTGADENSFAGQMARRSEIGNNAGDALWWYNSNFINAGMDNSKSGKDTLRHLCVLMYGLGMRESSGKFCEGRDQSASNTSADSAEAGLFQTSYDARGGAPDIVRLLDIYKHVSDDPQRVGPVFHEGVSCSSDDLACYGSPSSDGYKFQYYQKASPMLAVQACGLVMRDIGGSEGHYGPLRRKEAQIKTDVDELFAEIERIVDNSAGV